jgi:tyrosine-protein kinase Etk/Wzc
MNSQSNNRSPQQQHEGPDEINLYEYLEVIIRYRKMIAYIVGVTFVLSIIVSLLLPKMYLATASILPPRETSSSLASLLSSTDSPLNGLAGNPIGQQTPAALYVGIMKSRSVADTLNRKFKLKKLYDLKYIEDVYAKLNDRATIEVSKNDQIISVSVKDRDPQRAADMANAYVDALDQINRQLNISEGHRKRAFLGDRLKEVASELEKAETTLKAFQERYHLIAIEEQAKVAIEGAAELKGQIIAAQTELNVFKKFGTEMQNEAIMLRTKIDELQKQLALIEEGTGKKMATAELSKNPKAPNFYIPIGDLPELGMQLMRLTRGAKIQEKVFELLTSQYEIAQIEEAKDVDTIQVLDRAVVPEKKYSPRRGFIIMVSILISMVLSILLVFYIEFIGKHRIKKE